MTGCTSLIFVNPGTKIDGCYYCNVVLMQQMLSSICSIAGDAYIFQQDSAPVHRARQTVELLQHETPKFIVADLWPRNSPDLSNRLSTRPSDMRCYAGLCYQTPVRDVTDLKQQLTDTWNRLSQSIVDDAVDEWQKRLRA